MSDNQQKSTALYLRERDARIYELFVREGSEPRDIALQMLAEGTIESDSEDSAIRIVRGVVAKIRKRLDLARTDDAKSEIATNDIDAIERKLARLRADHAWQISKSEDDSTVTHVMVTPNGEMAIQKFNWPPGVRQKARKDAGLLAEKIAEIEMVLAEKRVATEKAADGERDSGLTINESGKSIAELIEQNLSGVN